jgi:hypothetical protein
VCTLIVGRGIPDPETVVLAANRDEEPSRPSDPPDVLVERPRVVGGRDRLAGGTWLAIRERRAAVAILNRRPAASGPATTRSRGLLALDVAGLPDETPPRPLADRALDGARRLAVEERYGPFSLVWASPGRCWMMSHPGDGSGAVAELSRGWHVITHAELDDPVEPRTVRLLGALADFAPHDPDETLRGLLGFLRLHGEEGRKPGPPVCIHEGRMVTVSSSLVALGNSGARYLHVEGRPCENEPLDRSHLLMGDCPEVTLA